MHTFAIGHTFKKDKNPLQLATVYKEKNGRTEITSFLTGICHKKLMSPVRHTR